MCYNSCFEAEKKKIPVDMANRVAREHIIDIARGLYCALSKITEDYQAKFSQFSLENKIHFKSLVSK